MAQPAASPGPRDHPTAPADRRWMILVVVAVAQLTVVLDSTIVNIALPSAQHALGFANSDRQWVVTGYALAFGSLLLDDVFAHPRHEAAQQALPGLIVQQRAAANVKDGYELQLELIGHVRETEEARNAFSKAVKRMQDGKSPQLDAPEPQPGRDPSLLETCSSNTACASALPGSSAAWRCACLAGLRLRAPQHHRLCQNAPSGVWPARPGHPPSLTPSSRPTGRMASSRSWTT